jgi:hypothetical protein
MNKTYNGEWPYTINLPNFKKNNLQLKVGLNNVVQLVSRASGRSLQIIMSPTQQLVIDGAGLEGPQAFNSKYSLSFHTSGLKRTPSI